MHFALVTGGLFMITSSINNSFREYVRNQKINELTVDRFKQIFQDTLSAIRNSQPTINIENKSYKLYSGSISDLNRYLEIFLRAHKLSEPHLRELLSIVNSTKIDDDETIYLKSLLIAHTEISKSAPNDLLLIAAPEKIEQLLRINQKNILDARSDRAGYLGLLSFGVATGLTIGFGILALSFSPLFFLGIALTAGMVIVTAYLLIKDARNQPEKERSLKESINTFEHLEKVKVRLGDFNRFLKINQVPAFDIISNQEKLKNLIDIFFNSKDATSDLDKIKEELKL